MTRRHDGVSKLLSETSGTWQKHIGQCHVCRLCERVTVRRLVGMTLEHDNSEPSTPDRVSPTGEGASEPGLTISALVFPRVTQLDLTGRVEVFARLPGVRIRYAWHSLAPVPTSAGFAITPTSTFADAAPAETSWSNAPSRRVERGCAGAGHTVRAWSYSPESATTIRGEVMTSFRDYGRGVYVIA